MCLQIVSHYDSHYLCVIYDFSPHRTEICLAMTNWKEDCTKHHQYVIIAQLLNSSLDKVDTVLTVFYTCCF